MFRRSNSIKTFVENPDTLFDTCLKYVINNLHSMCTRSTETNEYILHADLSLPSEICESLIEVYQNLGKRVDDRFISLFKNPTKTAVKRVRLRHSHITDDGLRILLTHHLQELDLSYCPNLTPASLNVLNLYGDRLISLSIGGFARILPTHLSNASASSNMDVDMGVNFDFEPLTCGGSDYKPLLHTPNLRRLTVRAHYVPSEKEYFPTLLKPLVNLIYLDLSSCADIGKLDYIHGLKSITTLVLYNVANVQEMLPAICTMKTIRHLDISQPTEKHGRFRNENDALAMVVENLPFLESLDISGTNLAGKGVAMMTGSSNNNEATKLGAPLSDIPGLYSRVNRPLEFLGLYNCLYGACNRHHIPAKRISGDNGEQQILTAASAYLDRPDILQKVLNDLYHLFRYESCHDLNTALYLVLAAMERHKSEKHIQISGSATLFYIVKGRDKQLFPTSVKRQIVFTLINGMSEHKSDDTMMRNGCLTLCQFKIPQDVLFEYKRLVGILLHIVSAMEQEGFVQRIGIYLLNSLACQVDGVQKKMLGDLGAIGVMLILIQERLGRKVCDDVLEVAWSTMWNVTDETAVNCERFLQGDGMNLFLGCLETFPDKEELLRNMMGLLGNVAEVKQLRSRLMTPQFVKVFADLLDSRSDGIEVSYNAAGVLSHMASDGPDVWTIELPKRADVLASMIAAIERWDLATERNINYRSFEPILHLVNVYHTPECQHWAVWALANLTHVYPNKYCQLVVDEGGLVLLSNLLSNPAPYNRIKELAEKVIDQCRDNLTAMTI